jgi:hypothetical protein
VPIVLKSGSLKLLEPSGPVKACIGIVFTDTHSFYVIGLLIDFPCQQWFRKRAMALHYTCIAYLVFLSFILVSPSENNFFRCLIPLVNNRLSGSIFLLTGRRSLTRPRSSPPSRKPKVCYCAHRSKPMVPILSLINPVDSKYNI